MELRLSEALLVLALNERSGRIATFSPERLRFGLAGAVLQELAARGKIKVDGELVKVLDTDPTGDEILDKAMEIISKSAKDKKVQHWIGKLGEKSKGFKKILINNLVSRGVLKEREEERTWVLPGKRYRVWADRQVKVLRKTINDILLEGKEPDAESLKVVVLVWHCKLHWRLFKDKKEREKARERLVDLSENDAIGKGIKKGVNNARGTVISSFSSIVPIVIKSAC